MKELARNANNISLEIQQRERERIILEVHDGIAQTLASLSSIFKPSIILEASETNIQGNFSSGHWANKASHSEDENR